MAGFCDLGFGLQTPESGKCEVNSPKVSGRWPNITVFGRLRQETWFDRDCRLNSRFAAD